MKGFQDSKGNCLCTYTATRTHKTGEAGCYWWDDGATHEAIYAHDPEQDDRPEVDDRPVAATQAIRAMVEDVPPIEVRAAAAGDEDYPALWDAESDPVFDVPINPFGQFNVTNTTKEPNMKVSITPKQTRKRPQRTTVHGEPGIGKTTFAANAPDVVFLCTESGADNVNVSHLHYDGHDPRTYDEVLAALEGVPTDGSVKNVCIDTIDGLEGIIHAHIKTTTNKPVGEHGYGKGYDKALDLMRGVLASLERLRDRGIGTILLAHSTIENFANPEGADFSYVTIKAHKKISGLIVEWSDAVFYARREQRAYTNDSGKTIGVGSSKRELCTEKTPTFVAKNRLRLPPKMPLSWADYQHAIDTFVPLDAKALRVEATELAAAFGAEAMAELEKIGDDAGDLLAFVEYCKGLKKA